MLCVHYLRKPVEYNEAYKLQQSLWLQNLNGESPDTLLMLSHVPTFTIGKSGKLDNLLLTREELKIQGIPVYFSDRGGDITYHGPGQLVAYPIMDLRKQGKDIHRYIYALQEVLIQTLDDFSIEAKRDDEHVGVWAGDEKIAAIGVRVKKWITMHGIALNVNPIMEHFSFINPCGITDKGVTSITGILGHDVPFDDVVERMVERFAAVFDVKIEWAIESQTRCLL
ncbi:MAG TPA: lipoyl(octanoyl) transferase LipB [Dehalococcoidia bacterium]|nr:lipoyl(octanoyl) transferase LipB [Dehalococcoidia bacterium]